MDLAQDHAMTEPERQHLEIAALIQKLECPTTIQTEEEVKALLQSTQRLEDICRKEKEQLEKRLQQVYLDLKEADLHLFKVEVQMGRVQHVICKAGFSQPPPRVDRPKPDVTVDGTLHTICMRDLGSMGVDLD
ncbi:hypothetical protein NLJ89_g12315 [Agrocybe chaxingu]|uniref:Uncharacterized protein n=1 Tax=Agrocybe chaxingu TaxID=84603 RepID=A0A9W8JNC5_9AGAR|nr:hypothetical protein NLJ89_g12315 [Agrocybe chaxingu]